MGNGGILRSNLCHKGLESLVPAGTEPINSREIHISMPRAVRYEIDVDMIIVSLSFLRLHLILHREVYSDCII